MNIDLEFFCGLLLKARREAQSLACWFSFETKARPCSSVFPKMQTLISIIYGNLLREILRENSVCREIPYFRVVLTLGRISYNDGSKCLRINKGFYEMFIYGFALLYSYFVYRCILKAFTKINKRIVRRFLETVSSNFPVLQNKWIANQPSWNFYLRSRYLLLIDFFI